MRIRVVFVIALISVLIYGLSGSVGQVLEILSEDKSEQQEL